MGSCNYFNTSRLKRMKLCFFSFCCLWIFGCEEQINYLMPYIDISPDDKTIAYTYYDTLSSSIYEFSLSDSSIVRIAKSTKEDYYQPKYSPDGKKILIMAIGHQGKQFPRILMYNKADSSLKQISDNTTMIVQAVFSRDGGGIYFIAASSYGNSSPVARPGPHGNDIFYMDTNGANVRQITNLRAYAMNGLALTKDGEKIYSAIWTLKKDTAEELSGLYVIPTKSPQLVQKFSINNPVLRLWNTEKPLMCDLNEGDFVFDNFISPVISQDDKKLLVIPTNDLK